MNESLFNARLKQAMELRKVKQVDIVKNTGISKSLISQYLKGTVIPKQNKMYSIAKYLDVGVEWLSGHLMTLNNTIPKYNEEKEFIATMKNDALQEKNGYMFDLSKLEEHYQQLANRFSEQKEIKQEVNIERLKQVIERYKREPIQETPFNELVEALNQTINIIEYDIGDYLTMYSYNITSDDPVKDLQSTYNYFKNKVAALDDFINNLDENNPNHIDAIMDITIELDFAIEKVDILKEYVKDEAE